MSDQMVLGLIAQTRLLNNELWMRLLEIALQHAPEETKDVLREIRGNDQRISDLLGRIL